MLLVFPEMIQHIKYSFPLMVAIASALLFISPVTSAEKNDPIGLLKDWVANEDSVKEKIESSDWTNAHLSKEQAIEARKILWKWFKGSYKKSREESYKSKVIKLADKTMKYEFKVFGEKPANGRSLFITMHGGGGAPSRVNDSQWRNQIRLYKPKEGVYVAPRAPTDTWNLWHQEHIDPMFDQLILDMVIFQGVNPNKVYINGYSAGGDGVFQLAPRMADRYAAAAMMAGHPNETKADGLRNLPFALYMGGRDAAYSRNQKAKDWEGFLGELKKKDQQGYTHRVVIYPDFGHWMNGKDSEAFPWMTKFTRNSRPGKIVWLQDDVTHDVFYWLGVPSGKAKARSLTKAEWKGQELYIKTDTKDGFVVYLDDRLTNLDEPISVFVNGEKRVEDVRPYRNIKNLYGTLIKRKDPAYLFPAVIEIASKAE